MPERSTVDLKAKPVTLWLAGREVVVLSKNDVDPSTLPDVSAPATHRIPADFHSILGEQDRL